MNREERIKQFANDMELFGDYVTEYGVERFDYDKTATELDGLGYHKTIWHKVADGDLPKDDRSIRWFDKGKCYIEGYYDTGTEKFVVDCDNYFYKDKVIAWTELPTYEE